MRNLAVTTIIILSLITLASSCKGKKGVENKKEVVQLKMVEVPSIVSDPVERSKYILDHFWNVMNFNDTTYLSNIQGLNVHFSAYIEYLTTATANDAKASVIKLSDSILNGNPKIVSKFREMFETAFYEPNSIYKNEELYITVLEKFITSPKVSDAERIQMRYQLDLAYKNRLGTKALDFKFILENGESRNLYDISSEYTLLIFIEPDCSSCKSVLAQMGVSSILSDLSSKVKVLTIYAGNDFNKWMQFVPKLNKNWINGCDKEMKIMGSSLYDLRPAPSLYLLNKQKVVICKDAPFNYIEEYLKKI
jgi:hypothetical protein